MYNERPFLLVSWSKSLVKYSVSNIEFFTAKRIHCRVWRGRKYDERMLLGSEGLASCPLAVAPHLTEAGKSLPPPNVITDGVLDIMDDNKFSTLAFHPT